MSVILELLRGADLETTSRKHRVTVAKLTEWRDRLLAGGEASLKSRETDVEDEEKKRLKSVVASLVEVASQPDSFVAYADGNCDRHSKSVTVPVSPR